ncbi:MAG: hypothetical protein VKK80_04050 [Prochlorothrix sp.]|nr:hypothetical protein [Prochlorothrix sp.]
MATTPEEVWQLLGELVQAQKETDRRLKELGEETDRRLKELGEETDRKFKEFAQEADRRSQETDRKFKEFAQEADRRSQEADRRSQEADRRSQETDRQLQETDRQLQETARQLRETDRQLRETDRQLRELDEQVKELGKQMKELGRQVGGLGAKFGSFTEGMAYPSMARILQEQFGMDCVGPRVRRRRNGQEIELDVLAYANSDRQAVYVVEVKSHPREESIEQMRRLLQRFPEFFPEHHDKALYGILAAVDVSAAVREQFLAEGLYVARIEDEVFALDVPEGFQARSWP